MKISSFYDTHWSVFEWFKAAQLTCPGVTGVGQSEEGFLLKDDAPTNQEGRQKSQGQTQPQVVAAARLQFWNNKSAELRVCLTWVRSHKSDKSY